MVPAAGTRWHAHRMATPAPGPTPEQAYRAAEADLEAARASDDPVRIASAEAWWADAAEVWADEQESSGGAVPGDLRERVDRYRQDTAAG